jgi:hypothetical protein
MNLQDILNGSATNKDSANIWNYAKIHENNICECKSKILDLNEFLSLKASTDLKKKIRSKLRKTIDSLNETFLTANDKNDKLKSAQSIKIFTENLGGLNRVSTKVFEFLKTLDKVDKK